MWGCLTLSGPSCVGGKPYRWSTRAAYHHAHSTLSEFPSRQRSRRSLNQTLDFKLGANEVRLRRLHLQARRQPACHACQHTALQHAAPYIHTERAHRASSLARSLRDSIEGCGACAKAQRPHCSCHLHWPKGPCSTCPAGRGLSSRCGVRVLCA